MNDIRGLKRIMIFNCSPDREPLDLLAPYVYENFQILNPDFTNGIQAEVHAEYKFDIALFCPNTGSSKTSPGKLIALVGLD